jgi:hypothetical protein
VRVPGAGDRCRDHRAAECELLADHCEHAQLVGAPVHLRLDLDRPRGRRQLVAARDRPFVLIPDGGSQGVDLVGEPGQLDGLEIDAESVALA